MENPFNITKANDYTDFEIQDYWVDIFGEKEKIKPTSPMPILIKGSKGCGKTHLLKYFSYELQKIRANDDNSKILKEDKYLGVFMRCSALDSHRFSGKGISEEDWNLIYSNYLELWFGQKLISILLDFEIELFEQQNVVEKILELFDKQENLDAQNLQDLLSVFIKIQKDFDHIVKNIGFKRNEKPDLDLLLNTGSLIYGIPKIICQEIKQFENVFFLYIVDEFENITSNYQKIFNSLYREKDFPGSFRIGGRLHAFTNFNTLGSGEENRKGSEYELIILDEERRNDEKKYKDFVIKICIKKLNNFHYNEITSKEEFLDHFEIFNEEIFLEKIKNRAERISNNHTKRLIFNLNKVKESNDIINDIVENIKCEDNKLLEKVNYLLFYRYWKSGKNLLNSSKVVQEEFSAYLHGNNKDNDFEKVIQYFKIDLLDQLARESSLDVHSIINVENYIKMSSGTPRNFLNVIKESFDYEYFKENKVPFKDGNKISVDSQVKSLKKVYEWFFDVNRIPHINSEKISPLEFLDNLCNYLNKLRFSNVPPECSINLFSVSNDFINKHNEIFTLLLNNSYLLESNDRRGKNDDKLNKTYFINGTIAPKYDLSINRRGYITINEVIGDALINNDKNIINEKINEYNAPFKFKEITKKYINPTLDFPKNE